MCKDSNHKTELNGSTGGGYRQVVERCVYDREGFLESGLYLHTFLFRTVSAFIIPLCYLYLGLLLAGVKKTLP